MTTNNCYADKRTAGANVVHKVYDWYGREVDTRRSQHSYDYVIVRRSPNWYGDGRASIIAVRWSRSSKCSSGQWAIPVTNID